MSNNSLPPAKPAHRLIVEVEGGQVEILGHFNLFALDGPDRELLSDLSDLVRKHEHRKAEALRTANGASNEAEKPAGGNG